MNDQLKAILLAQGKALAIQVLESAGNALLKTARELEQTTLTIEHQS